MPQWPSLLPGLLACLVAMTAVTAAEPVYVRDRLLVAVRETPAPEAKPVALLVSGTEVEVLERRGEYARVRTADGKEGWLELAYLTTDLPATRVIARLERQNASLRAELARSRGQGAGQGAADAATVKQLREALASERLRNAELEARLTEAQRDRRGAPGQAAELARLRTENERLRQALAQARARAWLLPATLDWRLLAAAAALLLVLVFAAGAWFVDWRLRRRHGGFRV